MGADGSVKLKRSELVRESTEQKVNKLTQQEYNTERWHTCQLTNKVLRTPAVSDYKGLLYNKESILEALVEPEKFGEPQRQLISHITGLKDVATINLNGGICPITGNDLGSGGVKYVYIVSCGDCFAEKCLKLSKECPVCSEPYVVEDEVITLNPGPDDLSLLQQRMDRLIKRGITHSLKKAKKSRKTGGGGGGGGGGGLTGDKVKRTKIE